MSKEKNTSNLRMMLSNLIEKYDVFMLRRSPMIQKLWVLHVNRKAKKLASEYLVKFKSTNALIEGISNETPNHRIVQIEQPDYDVSQKEIFQSLVDFIGSDIQGKSFFDIGPGAGHSMDLARDAGSSVTAFIDIDPAFYSYNVLKGHMGYIGDYYKGKSLGVVFPNRYDYIVSRGSLNADQFNRNEPGVVSFAKLLQLIDDMWTGDGMILINPTFDRGTTPGQNYWCRDVEVFLKSSFCTELFSRGYEKVYIEMLNHPHYHPYTFVKRSP